MLVALLGAQLTIVVLVLWVRVVAVSMASRMFSASLSQSFLHDRFQQVTMGLVIGVLAYSIVVSQAVPDTGAGMTTMPHYSVALALALALVVAVLVVGSVSEGARTSRTGSMLRRVGDDVLAQVRAAHPERGQVHGAARADLASPEPPDRPSHVVRADHSGWVQRLEEDRLLSALPPRAVTELDVRVGHFLTEGTPLCRVWTVPGDAEQPPEPGRELDAAVDRNLRTAVVLGDGPTLEQDVAFGLRMLSDVAERALAPASGDTSAVEQAIVRLGVVLRELLLRDLPAPTRQDQHERMLLRPCELGIDDHVHKAFDRIRQAGVDSPAVAAALLNTLAMLRDALEEVDRHPVGDPVAASSGLDRGGGALLGDAGRRLPRRARPRRATGAGEPPAGTARRGRLPRLRRGTHPRSGGQAAGAPARRMIRARHVERLGGVSQPPPPTRGWIAMVDIAALTMMALVALGVTYALGVRRGRALAQAHLQLNVAHSDDVDGGGRRRSADASAGVGPTAGR